MVANFWNESLYPKIKQAEDFTADQFYKSQWQKKSGVSVFYLVYKWVAAVLLFVYAIATLFEKDPLSRPSLIYPKYPIYFTNWIVWVTSVQSLLAVGIVTYSYINLRKQKEGVENEESIHVQRIIKLYWATQTIAIVGSIVISVIFWVVVYNPEINPLNVFTFVSHGVLAVYLVIDALIVAHPFRLTDYIWVFLFAIAYLIFTIIYYLAGGLDRYNRSFIYNMLDWQETGNAIVTSIIFIAFSIFVHFIVWSLTYSTRKLVYYLYHKEGGKPKVETVIDIIDTEAPPSGK